MNQITVEKLEKQVMFNIQDEDGGGCSVHLYRYHSDRTYDHYLEKKFPVRIHKIWLADFYDSVEGSYQEIIMEDRFDNLVYKVDVTPKGYVFRKNKGYFEVAKEGMPQDYFDKGTNAKDCPFWDNLWVALQDDDMDTGRIQ